MPYIKSSGEQKSKPTQHSVKELMGMGISPDIVVCRCDIPLDESALHKISLFCDVKPDCVIPNLTVEHIYEAPMMLEESGFSSVVCRELGLDAPQAELSEWKAMLGRIKSADGKVKIGLAGKYVKMYDAYLSVAEALRHGGYENGVNVEIEWIEAEDITVDSAERMLSGLDGILVPGGFGDRGRKDFSR